MPISQKFMIAFGLVSLAAVLGVTGIIFPALLIGLVGGFVLIKEMIKKYF